MIEKISNFFLGALGKHLTVFMCSLLPVIELRGAIPLGAGFGLPWWQTYILSVVGNMLPVPFILLFIKRFMAAALKSKIKGLNRFALYLQRKAEKNREKIEKYSFWGLALFVAIPLPVTGAWTGSLVAAMIDMKFWKAFLSALTGVLIAGIIMTLGAYGIVAFFKIFV